MLAAKPTENQSQQKEETTTGDKETMIVELFLGLAAIGVLILAIFVGAHGLRKIHESYEAEKEEYAQKRVAEEKTKWEQNKQ